LKLIQYPKDTEFVPHSKATVRVGTTRNTPLDLYYELYGTGPIKLLFIMGFATTCRGWAPNMAHFVMKHPEYQMCIFDNRGSGRSSSPSGRWTTSRMALDALELVQNLGWNRFHVVGVSMGGMISMELASLFAEGKVDTQGAQLCSLLLAVTHAGGKYATVPFQGASGFVGTMFKKDPTDMGTAVLNMVYSQRFLNSKVGDWTKKKEEEIKEGGKEKEEGGEGEQVDQAEGTSSEEKELNENIDNMTFRDVLLRMYLERIQNDPRMGLSALMGHVNAITTHSLSSHRLKKIKAMGIPIGIVTGTDDPLVRPQNSHVLKDHLEPTEFLVWEGAGHAVNVEMYHDFNSLVHRLVEEGEKRFGKDSEERPDEVNNEGAVERADEINEDEEKGKDVTEI